MFSSDIDGCSIELENCVFFSIGHKCSSAIAARTAGLRSFALPFDWCEHVFPQKVINVLENNFEDFIPDTFDNLLVPEEKENICYYKNKYDIHICHIDSTKTEEIIAAYKRRILRAIDVLNGTQNVCFLYANEGYLWNKDFRYEDFNKQTFAELVAFDTYIKTKYPQLKYKIVFIDFVKHDVPAQSNIVNMVVHSTEVYDVHIDGVVNDFRIHCAKLLNAIF